MPSLMLDEKTRQNREMKKFDLIWLFDLEFDLQGQMPFGNRVILKAWPIMILSGMVVSFEQKMPSKVFLRALACRLLCRSIDCIAPWPVVLR